MRLMTRLGRALGLGRAIRRLVRIGRACEFGPGVTLGRHFTCGADCRVGGAKLGDRVALGRNVCVQDSVVGSDARIMDDSSLWHSEIASYSYIALGSRISAARIGRFVSIGPSVGCGLGDHPTSWMSTSPAFYSPNQQVGVTFGRAGGFEESARVEIGNDVWVGAHVYIKNGVKVADGAIVAAGAVVVADVPPYAIVGGVPARVIRSRFPDDVIKEMLQVRWWEFPEHELRRGCEHFTQPHPGRFLQWAAEVRGRLTGG